MQKEVDNVSSDKVRITFKVTCTAQATVHACCSEQDDDIVGDDVITQDIN